MIAASSRAWVLPEGLLPNLDWTRFKAATRTGVAAMGATALITIFQLPFGAWALVTIMVMTQPTIGASVGKGLMRVVGTLVGGGVGIALLGYVQDPAPFIALLGLVLLVCTYMGAGQLFPYAFVMGGLTAAIVATLGITDSTHAVYLACYRMGEVALGVAIAVFTSVALWPTHAQDELARSLGSTLDLAAELLHEAVKRTASGAPGLAPGRRRAVLETLRGAFQRHGQLLAQAAYETRQVAAQRPIVLRQILQVDQLSAIALEIDALAVRQARAPGAHPVGAELAAVASEITRATAGLAHAIRARSGFALGEDAFEPSLAALAARYAALRGGAALSARSLAEMERFDAAVSGLREMGDVLRRAAATTTRIAAGAVPAKPPGAAPQAVRAPRLALDRRRLQFAVKCVLSTVFTLLGWVCLQWDGGVPAVISAYIVTQASVGGANRKVLLRLTGTLVGAGIAFATILLAVPVIDTLAPFAALVFVVTAGCAWVMLGSERIAYAGLQAAMAFILTMFPEALQPTSITPATTRAIAVVLAASISILVCRLFWPVHAGRDLRVKLAAILDRTSRLLDEIVSPLVGATEPSASSPSALQTSGPTYVARLREQAEAALHDVGALTPLVGEATLEARDQGFRRHQGIAVLGAIEETLRQIGALAAGAATPLGEAAAGLVRDEVGQLCRATRVALGALAAGLRTPTGGVAPQLRPELARLDARLLELRHEQRLSALPLEERRALFVFLAHLEELARSVQGVATAIEHPSAL